MLNAKRKFKGIAESLQTVFETSLIIGFHNEFAVFQFQRLVTKRGGYA